MSFMQPEITTKQRGWIIDTHDGVYCVPDDVVSVPDVLRDNVGITSGPLFDAVLSMLGDYIPTCGRVCEIEARTGYFARMSAPGYLDCTDWVYARTLADARRALREED